MTDEDQYGLGKSVPHIIVYTRYYHYYPLVEKQASGTCLVIQGLRLQFWASLVVSWLGIHLVMRTWFDPWSRKTPRATEQPSPWATTVEPVGPRPLSSETRDATAVRSLCSAPGEQPLPTARGRPRPAAKTSAVQIKIKKKKQLCTSSAGGMCSVPGRGTEIAQAT